MDFGADVNSDVYSCFDIVLYIDLWRSQIRKSGNSFLVHVVVAGGGVVKWFMT